MPPSRPTDSQPQQPNSTTTTSQPQHSLAESLDEFFKDGMEFELNNGNLEGDNNVNSNNNNMQNMFSFGEDGEDLNMDNIAMYLGDDIDALFGDIFVPPGPNDGQNNNNSTTNGQHPGASHHQNNTNNPNMSDIQHAHHLANSAKNILAMLDSGNPSTSAPQQQQGAQPSVYLQPGQVITLPNGQTVQLVLQPPFNNNMMNDGNPYNNTHMYSNIGATGAGSDINGSMYPRSASTSPTKQTSKQQQQPPKRRRAPNGSRAPSYTETAAQRSARLAQGFSFDPTTGRMFRHGPALIAAAKQDKDVPPVNDVFEAFARQPFGVESPSPSRRPLGDREQEDSAGGGADTVSTISDEFLPSRPQQQQQQPRRRGGGPMPAGHGSITNLVTQELKSAPVPPSAAAMNNNNVSQLHSQYPGASGPEGSVNLLGVSRDKWNLFWDAWVASPTTANNNNNISSITEGFKQEAIHLGKFPTQAQAGRARDIATLKLFGPTNEMNFPVDTYRVAIGALQAHSGEEVVEALRKDSQLALQRTSKYKGVRRVGPGCFEATAPAETAIGM